MAAKLQLQPFDATSEELFLQLAAEENWITDRNEFSFLRLHYPQGSLIAKAGDETAGFITAMRYATSAWVGNLIVAPEHRSKGVGRMLMQEVVQRLDASGCNTIWLTASSNGTALYRSMGFESIDSIRRWRTCGRLSAPLPAAVDLQYAAVLDRMGWGDKRSALFTGCSRGSGWLLRNDAFLRCLQSGTGTQLGPWGAASSRGAARLLEKTLQEASDTGTIFLDVPEKNLAAARLLRNNGFSAGGSTLLMYRGRKPEYRPEVVFALASMGSYG